MQHQMNLQQTPHRDRQSRASARTQNAFPTRSGRISKPTSARNSPQVMRSRSHHAALRPSASFYHERPTRHDEHRHPFVSAMTNQNTGTGFPDPSRPFSWHPGYNAPSMYLGQASSMAYYNHDPTPTQGNHSWPSQHSSYNQQLAAAVSPLYSHYYIPSYGPSSYHMPHNNPAFQGMSWLGDPAHSQPQLPRLNNRIHDPTNQPLPRFNAQSTHANADNSFTGIGTSSCQFMDEPLVRSSGPISNSTSLFEDRNSMSQKQTSGGEQELVGMGLYDDKPSKSKGLSLLGSGPSLPEPQNNQDTGHGLKLEETWQPPPEQVPDAVEDEGIETPTSNEFPPDIMDSSAYTRATIGFEPQVFRENMPGANISEQSFLFEDDGSSSLSQDWWPYQDKNEEFGAYDFGHMGWQMQDSRFYGNSN